MITYHLTASGYIQRSDGACIPNDPSNADYADYLAWVAEGNIAIPYVSPAPTWSEFKAQALAALDASDTTMHRIVEAVALGSNSMTNPDIIAFVNYRRALRTIVSTPSGVPGILPPHPGYPAGS